MLSKVVAYKLRPISVRQNDGSVDLVIKGGKIRLHPSANTPPFIQANAMARITHNDFPSNTYRLPIFSQVALDILGENWGYKTVDIQISGQDEQEWVALQLLNYTDVLNLVESQYDEDDLYHNNVAFLHKTVFRTDVDLPPIFQIQEDEGVFVTPETRLVWDMNNVSGMSYFPVFSE